MIQDINEIDFNTVTPFLLVQITKLWQSKLKKNLRPLNLTNAQFGELINIIRLEKNNEFVTQIMISEATKSDVMTVSQVVKTLERKHFVKRFPHPSDNRAICVQSTDEGKKKIPEAVEIATRLKKTFFNTIENEETMLISFLQKLIIANKNE